MATVRAAELSDEAALLALVRAFPTPTPPDTDAFAAVLRTKLNDVTSYLLVAVHDSALIGYVSGYRHAAFYAGGETAWVDELLVKQTHRQLGIGRLLMEAFEERAVADGCKLVSLATSGAGSFYARLGYETKAGYYKKYLRSAEQAIPTDSAKPRSG